MVMPAARMASVMQRDSEVLPDPGTARLMMTVFVKRFSMILSPLLFGCHREIRLQETLFPKGF